MITSRLTLRQPLTLLRRPSGALQLGLDARAPALLADAPAGAEAVVRAFNRATTIPEVQRLHPDVDPTWVAGAVERLLAAGTLVAAPDGHAPAPVAVVGPGELATRVAVLLARTRPREVWGVGVQATHPRLRPAGDLVRMLAAGPALVVVCTPTIEPDRVLTGELARAGVPHLLVRDEPERAVVGPLVVPGVTACVRCCDLARSDSDPDWPYLLAELCRTDHRPSPVACGWASATAAAQALAWLDGHPPETLGASLELDAATCALEARRWHHHPRCRCLQSAKLASTPRTPAA